MTRGLIFSHCVVSSGSKASVDIGGLLQVIDWSVSL